MGNYRFRFSDMMPNAWFYKLKDMSKGKNQGSRKKKQQSSSVSATATQPTSKPKQTQQCNPRKSYYFTRELTPSDTIYSSPAPNPEVFSSETLFPEPPRKSSKQKPKRKSPRSSSPKLVNSSVSAGCNCRTTVESVWTKSDSPPECSSSPFDDSSPEPEFRTDRVLAFEPFDETDLSSNSCGCRLNSNAQDIVIDVDKKSIARKDDKLNGCDSFTELELPPIKTKPAKFNDLLIDAKKGEKPRSRIGRKEEPNLEKTLKVKIVKEDTASIKENRGTPVAVRRFSVSSPGIKLRIHSPRIGFGSRKFQGHGRKSVSSSSSSSRRSLSGSFAVVKSSFNPQRDFRESMVEMIVENNIRASKDLEDLLACFLSLNSDEYHDIIIQVFKQIWFDLTDTH
ncbi:hypothetical protein L6164_002476 [Bauhinia variegata]|uniref:Uncharacterized protein n=1 Tax=Bauhinia variegata TaxID=167791 RepID=A0ACB9PYG2_BAUVA|nr:hypothetical protein L6164_002476 [Bauhinia variegata]